MKMVDTERIRKAAQKVVDNANELGMDRELSESDKKDLRILAKAIAGLPVVKLDKLPLTKRQVENRKDADGFISAVIPLGLEDLGIGVECLNDACSDMILGDASGLEDVSCRPVGIVGEEVLVEVTGYIGSWLERQK